MFKTKSFIFILFALSCTNLLGQPYLRILDSLNTNDFGVIVDAVESFYLGKDTGKGSGYKQFKRWETYQQTRLNEKGEIHASGHNNWDYFLNRNNANLKSSAAVKYGNWKELGPIGNTYATYFSPSTNFGNGRVNTLAVDPENSHIIYACTPGGGLWRSETQGDDWTPLTDGMPRLGVSGIAIDPESPMHNRVIYLLSGDSESQGASTSLGVFKSLDNGTSWYKTGLEFSKVVFPGRIKLSPNDANTIFVTMSSGTKYGLYVSRDGGLNWEGLLANASLQDIAFHPENPETIYIATRYGGAVYISEDNGFSWSIRKLEDVWYSRVELATSEDEPNSIWAIAGATGSLFKSENRGESFELLHKNNLFTKQQSYNLTLAVDPTNANNIFLGAVKLFKSQDGGHSFDQYSGGYMHNDQHDLLYTENGLLVANDGGVYAKLSNKEDFVDISRGLRITQVDFMDNDENSISPLNIIGTQDNGTNFMKAGQSFHMLDGDGTNCYFGANGRNEMYGSYQGGNIFRFTNVTGDQFVKESIRPSEYEKTYFHTPFYVDKQNAGHIYVGYSNLYFSSHNGKNWQNLTTNISDKEIRTFSVASTSDSIIWMNMGDQTYKTIDKGANWQEVQIPTVDGRAQQILIHPVNHDTVWFLGYFSNELFESVDGGLNWKLISENLFEGHQIHINTLDIQTEGKGRIYVGTDVGIYTKSISDSIWHDFNSGMPIMEINDIDINEATGKIYAATYGRGVWEGDLIQSPDLDVWRNVFALDFETNTDYKLTGTGIRRHIYDIEHAYEGDYCVRFRGQDSLSSSLEVKLEVKQDHEYLGAFWFQTRHLSKGEGLTLEILDQNVWVTLSSLTYGQDFFNQESFQKFEFLVEPGSLEGKDSIALRVRLHANHVLDYIYLDNLTLKSRFFSGNAPLKSGVRMPYAAFNESLNGTFNGVLPGAVSFVNTSQVTNNFQENQFKIYPNPSHGTIQLAGNIADGQYVTSVSIYTLDGKELTSDFSLNGQEGSFQTGMDLSLLTNGIYLLQVQTNLSTLTKKLVIQ